MINFSVKISIQSKSRLNPAEYLHIDLKTCIHLCQKIIIVIQVKDDQQHSPINFQLVSEQEQAPPRLKSRVKGLRGLFNRRPTEKKPMSPLEVCTKHISRVHQAHSQKQFHQKARQGKPIFSAFSQTTAVESQPIQRTYPCDKGWQEQSFVDILD